MESSANTNDVKDLPPIEEESEEALALRHGDMKIACSPSRFAKTIQQLSPEHKDAIASKTGLGGLTHMLPVKLRRPMLVRLARRYISNKQSIHIGGNDIPITLMDVYHIMDLPIQGADINNRMNKPIDRNLLRAYGIDGKLRVNKLEQMIKDSKTPDDHFIRVVVLYAIGLVLAPTCQNYVDIRYLPLVENVADIPNLNWGSFTLTHLLRSICKFNRRDETCLQGNLPLLQYWYWEHVRAGSVSYSTIPPPLMARWDENNAQLRTDAYDEYNTRKLDRGVVTMIICGKDAPTNIKNDQATNKDRHADEEVRYRAQPQGQAISSQQMDMILQTVDERISEHEKKIGRQLMELEHKLDAKIITVNETLIDIKKTTGAQPRLSKAEDELRDVKRELQEMRSLFLRNTQSTPKRSYVQEQVTRGADTLPPTPRCNASRSLFADTTSRETSVKHVVQNKKLEPRKPIFDNDYMLTEEDYEVVVFIRMSHEPAEVAHIGDHVLSARHLKRNVNRGFFYDEVINAYAHISNVDTTTTSFLSTVETRKLLGQCGAFPFGCGSPWVERIAKKIVGRRMVHVVLNVLDIHWLLLVFNFDKEEIQVLNSSQGYRDKAKETALVNSIQKCIDEAVDTGLVTTSKPINITQWTTKCYTNIPQQEDGHSCGAFTLKYMLSWDGDQMTEHFTQAQIDIFSIKICSSLLRSDCNKIRKESYKNPITEEDYKASLPKETEGAADDIVEISNPNVATKPKQDDAVGISDANVAKKPKRKRGRPRIEKPDAPIKKVKEQAATKTIPGLVDGPRLRKPSQHTKSPFKTQ